MYYRDLTTRIDENGIAIRGIPFPIISSISVSWNEVEAIDRIDCSLLDRMRIAGPSARHTWWSFDPLRIRQSQGMKIRLVNPILGFKNLVITLSDLENALKVAQTFTRPSNG